MNLQALITELGKPAYVALDDQAAADALNGQTVAVRRSIPARDIKRYLTLAGKRAAIAGDANGAAAELALTDFDDFDVADAQVDAALTAVLDGLIAAGLLNADDKVAILAMGDSMISPAQSAGVAERAITAGDVQAARRRMG